MQQNGKITLWCNTSMVISPGLKVTQVCMKWQPVWYVPSRGISVV